MSYGPGGRLVTGAYQWSRECAGNPAASGVSGAMARAEGGVREAIAWMEGTAFYALAGAGAAAAPSLDALRMQLAWLLAGMCDDDPGPA